ncbi:ABC transporter ATP-binding protein [Desulfosarcina ovata]|uniref:Macrolide ABC transporter ATP-binding protein n=2 Tax=Desulfosarcina ovata TaxID=83564 RepID=A0A5K8AB28_9BACT|nr:ABC transporter ATP-binding protein [Desulfosarcina ovata]BBO83447.1 macrolide ABC transporter ATP-binding protein [Desulfosarcina ovata subsp. sediminis]BBO89797.1 macrolide ABC transporter ATP-binding protein [Desulfosarcina ovata subsp. ovata]
MIEVRNISKTFRSGRGVVNAINRVSITIRAGSIAAVMGKSGSGKSTLLNCVGGIDLPEKGEIHCFGTPVHRLSAKSLSRFQRRHLGFVFQRGNLLSYLTVAQNIGLPLALNGIGGKVRQARIEALLEAIDLLSAAGALPHELSGGETQRVSVARAIAHRPKLLLADEPTSNLDTATGDRIVQLMVGLAAQTGCTILMATHDRDLARFTEKIIELKDGKRTADS